MLAVALLALGCEQGDDAEEAVPAPQDNDAAAFAQIQSIRCDNAGESLSARAVELLSDTAVAVRVNEIHDCQRLIEGATFGPLVAVYPMKAVFEGPADQFEHEWVAIASLENWGPGEYGPLKITTNERHCLYLRREGGEWQGLMQSGVFCPDAVAPSAQPNLQAVAQVYGGADSPTQHRPLYPATARFRWDEVNRQYYIGIKCGTAWCSIGDRASLPGHDTIRGALLDSMPGYFDEQPVPITDGSAVIVGPVARISASRRLHDLPSNPSIPKNRHTLARVSMRTGGAAAQYEPVVMQALHLGRTPTGTGPLSANVMIKSEPKDSAEAWVVRYGATDRELRLGLGGPPHSGPGTVRWRWREPTRQNVMGTADSARVQSLDSSETARGGATALAAVAAPAAAWIPCQSNNCCTAEW